MEKFTEKAGQEMSPLSNLVVTKNGDNQDLKISSLHKEKQLH